MQLQNNFSGGVEFFCWYSSKKYLLQKMRMEYLQYGKYNSLLL